MNYTEEQKQHLIDMMRGDEELGLYEEPKQLFTDYPITELGDEEFKEAPIRQCELLSYDDNKYCYVKVEGIEKEIKRCYIYSQRARCGEVDCISVDEIKELLKEEPNIVRLPPYYERKQETLEEAFSNYINERHSPIKGSTPDLTSAKFGAKWQQEQDKKLYSEEEVKNIAYEFHKKFAFTHAIKWDWFFEQFKKK
jgi:hypothetical protein